MTTKREGLHVGTSGWQYRHWKGVFYPEDIAKKQWFAHYAGTFDTVEINNTFYNLPKAETFDQWRARTPAGFTFTLKFSRYGSHLKRLKDPAGSIGTFLDRAERLGEALGPILVQLPPNFKPNADRLAAFLDAAPQRHRWAVEFRNSEWLCETIYDVLGDHNAALVIHDLIDDHPRVVTADWVYLRFHGAGDGGNYTHQALSAAARRIKKHLAAGRRVYAYFNNDAHGHAVANAQDLRRYVLGR
ncbi:MAG: DUF72 domain-containing protein [Phycisphaerae bacterium]|nr:DUF72 domain-containing protein [Phycisphaerae bacterium]